ncbi:MAG: class I SAM-dependent methyltransferase [Gracilimonas sp.]|nr:class I SAM-dependent methyltransferase [Gracilimonas sp.]
MKEDKTNKLKKPWPTKDAMEQIYEKNLWGGDEAEFYSGSGSHHHELVKPYIDVVSGFLSSFKDPLVVCDLGCGDFNVSKELVEFTKKYHAVDIVADLIERNKKKFNHEHVTFSCLDIATEEWPSGDCVILRNVLQHVSNREIQSIVQKLYGYKYVILTEHIPEGDFTPNKDIISGQGIRLKKGSGVDLLAPPFNFEVKEHEEWLSLPAKDGKGIIVTTMYEVFDI